MNIYVTMYIDVINNLLVKIYIKDIKGKCYGKIK